MLFSPFYLGASIVMDSSPILFCVPTHPEIGQLRKLSVSYNSVDDEDDTIQYLWQECPSAS
jgi:hypothetical protein